MITHLRPLPSTSDLWRAEIAPYARCPLQVGWYGPATLRGAADRYGMHCALAGVGYALLVGALAASRALTPLEAVAGVVVPVAITSLFLAICTLAGPLALTLLRGPFYELADGVVLTIRTDMSGRVRVDDFRRRHDVPNGTALDAAERLLAVADRHQVCLHTSARSSYLRDLYCRRLGFEPAFAAPGTELIRPARNPTAD